MLNWKKETSSTESKRFLKLLEILLNASVVNANLEYMTQN